jgi:HEAT repeat protein
MARVLGALGGADEVHAEAAADLVALSPHARARLTTRSRDPDPAVRLGVMRVLARPGHSEPTPEEVALVIAALDDESPSVRFLAARTAVGGPFAPGGRRALALPADAHRRALEVTLEVLGTPAGASEEWPFLTLSAAEPGLEAAVPLLLEAYLREPEEVRANRLGSHVMSQIERHPAALRAALAPALRSDSPLRRARAAWVWAFSAWEAEPVESLLGELLASADALVRRWGVRVGAAVDRGRRTSRATLLRHLRDPDPGVRDEAVRMLFWREFADAETVAAVRTMLLDRSLAGRKDLLPSFVLAGPEFVPLLAEGLDDPEIRSACLSALSGMGRKAAAVLPRLERLRDEIPPAEADLLRFVGIVIDSIRR